MKVLGCRHAVINACGDVKVVVVMDRWRKAMGKIVSESNEASLTGRHAKTEDTTNADAMNAEAEARQEHEIFIRGGLKNAGIVIVTPS